MRPEKVIAQRIIEKSQLRMAIADDSLVIRKILGKFASHYNFAVVDCFDSGNRAYQARKFNPYDIILLDENMHGEKGSEVAQNIRAFHQEKEKSETLMDVSVHSKMQSPIIISISATCGAEFLKSFDDTLSKPIMKKDFDGLLERRFRWKINESSSVHLIGSARSVQNQNTKNASFVSLH